MGWTSETWEPSFPKWYNSLDEYEQAVLDAAIDNVLEVHGPEICKGEFGKPLGDGLYEFRVRQSLRAIRQYGNLKTPEGEANDKTVALRVFCHFYGDKVVLLLSGLDKAKNEKAQNKEIQRAKKLLRAFHEEQKREKKRQKRR
jgi:hypothetical protein